MDYELLKKELQLACHERRACKKGYAELLRSASVPEIVATGKHNWGDVWGSMFADIIDEKIARWYDGLQDEFHRAGVYVNEPTNKGLVIVSHTDQPLHFNGQAKVYIFGKAKVTAAGHCEVYCRCPDADIELTDNAWGLIERGRVVARDFATVQSYQEVTCYGSAHVIVSAGICRDYGHRQIQLRDNTTIYTNSRYNITYDTERITTIPITE